MKFPIQPSSNNCYAANLRSLLNTCQRLHENGNQIGQIIEREVQQLNILSLNGILSTNSNTVGGNPSMDNHRRSSSSSSRFSSVKRSKGKTAQVLLKLAALQNASSKQSKSDAVADVVASAAGKKTPTETNTKKPTRRCVLCNDDPVPHAVDTCSWERNHVLQHVYREFEIAPWQCKRCQQLYFRYIDLRKHIRIGHQINRSLLINRDFLLHWHRIKNKYNAVYELAFPGSPLTTRLPDNQMTIGIDSKMFKCKLCNRKLHRRVLHQHLLMHARQSAVPSLYCCASCDFTSAGNALVELQSHVSEAHAVLSPKLYIDYYLSDAVIHDLEMQCWNF